MRRPRALALCSLATAALAAACVTTGQATGELEEAAFFYHRDLRWQRFSQAADRLDPQLRERFMDHCTAIEGSLSIESVELVDVQLDEDNLGAVLRMRVSFVQSPSTTLQTIVVKERWKRIDGTWRLVSGAWPLPEAS